MASLERVEAPNGVVTYRSRLLAAAGVVHGFGTRIGGVSPAPFDSLNLGIAQAPGEPDTEERVAENGRRLLAAIGAPGATLVRIRQVHGNGVVAGSRFLVGSPEVLLDHGVDLAGVPPMETNDAMLFVAVDGRFAGLVILEG